MSRIPTWRNWLSISADVIQITTFFGLTFAALIGGAVAAIGWVTDVPSFWIAVGTPIAALATLVAVNVSRIRKNQSVQTDTKSISSNLTPLRDACRRVFGEARTNKHWWAYAAHKWGMKNNQADPTDEILNQMAGIVASKVPIWGRHTASDRIEMIKDCNWSHGRFEKGARRYRTRLLEDGGVFVDLAVTNRDVEDLMQFAREGLKEDTDIGNLSSHDSAQEYVAINNVAREVYGKTRELRRFSSFIENVSSRNGKLDHGTVLDVCALYIAETSVPIFGKHPPSIEWEKIDKSILKQGQFENGSFHRYGIDDPEFTEISIRAIDKDNAVNEIIEEARLLDQPHQAEEDFKRGFDKANFKRDSTRDNAVLRLAQLRGEGVVIRNDAARIYTTADLGAWSQRVSDWMHEVIETLKPISAADSEWFATLDIVPPARVQVPIRLTGDFDIRILQSDYNQHDFRLDRLERLLKKYGVAA